MGDREEKTVLFDESMLQQYQKNTTGKSSLVIVDGSGIQEYDLVIFIRLIGLDQVLVFFVSEILTVCVFEQENALCSLIKLLIR